MPVGNDWIEHLDILDAVRINQIGEFKSIEDIYTTRLDGIVVVGIKKDSEEYNQAKDILQKSGLNFDASLVENSLNSDFVRIRIDSIEDIQNMQIVRVVNGVKNFTPFSDMQKQAIYSVIELYSKDSNLMTEVKKTFMDEWMKRPNLNKLKLWWDKLPYAFSITSVGKVLAHANAQRCDKTLPSLN